MLWLGGAKNKKHKHIQAIAMGGGGGETAFEVDIWYFIELHLLSV